MNNLINTNIPWLPFLNKDFKLSKVKYNFYISKDLGSGPDPTVLSLARSGIKVRDISNNEGQLAESYDNYNKVIPGDLLLNPMDLYSGANCNVSEIEGVISPAYSNLRKAIDLNPKYFDYYFKFQYWTMAMFAHGKGVSFDNRWTMNADTLLNYEVPRPSLEQQNKIVSFLNSKTAIIDALIENEYELIKKIFKYKESLIRESVTKGIKKTDLKDSNNKFIGLIPTHWECVKNKTIITSCDGGLWGDDPNEDSKDKTVIRSTEQTIDGYWNIVDPAKRNLGNGELSYYRIRKGDLLLTKSSGSGDHIGKTTLADEYFEDNECYYSNFLQRIRVKINPKFEWYVLNCRLSRDQFVYLQNSTSGIGNINADNIKEIFIALPPRSEQDLIVEFLDNKCAEINNLISISKKKIETLDNYKKSLIYECVIGKNE